MLRNYLTVCWRNLLAQKVYSCISVVGLAIGLASCLVIGQYLRHELSFDRFHEKGERIYRFREGENILTPAAYTSRLREECPEIVDLVRLFMRGAPSRLEHERRALDPSGFIWADAGFFSTFTFPLLQGDPTTVLEQPLSVVLTETTARALFGAADPVGQVLRWEDRLDFTITGVAQDPPANSHIQFRYVVSFASRPVATGKPNALDNFTDFSFYTYLLLPEGCALEVLETKLTGFGERHTGDPKGAVTLQPLREIYFDTSSQFDFGPKGNRRSLWVFSAIGAFVLLMACANSINLTTARSARRAREVGLRRTLGAVRGQLIGQFMGESVLMSFIAMTLAVALAEVSAPAVRSLTGQASSLHVTASATMLAALVLTALFVGLVSGAYPALYLSRFAPVSTLRGPGAGGRGGAYLRRVLILVQFTITIALLVCTLVVRKQFRYMQDQDLGFQGDQVLVTRLDSHMKGQYELFRSEALRQPGVQQLSLLKGVPGNLGIKQGYQWPGDGGEEQGKGIYSMLVDPNTLETLGFELVAGRGLSGEIGSDPQHAYLLNQEAVRELGWDEAVGHPFRVWDREPGQVVGVVRDFNFKSLHHRIEPLVLYMRPQWCNTVAIRISPQDVRGTLAALKQTWDRLSPDYAFHYTFLSDSFGRAYEKEERLGRVFGVFFALAVGVACLGLLGLASYAAERRTREIGIRKALGASVASVTAMLSGEFTWLVLAANLAAWPVAWLAMQRWLAGFVYRTEVGPGIFLLASALALLIAWLTVGGQAMRAALANPVDALRSE